MAGLFKNKIIKENLNEFEIPNLEEKLSILNSWLNSYKNGELQKKNETQCEQSFNQDIFVKVLGYETFPREIYTILPKANVETGGGQMPDATLGYFDSKNQKVFAVVEIKDANTSLDKSQYRQGNLSPIQQAFKYKPQYKECGFVIATNFIEIRLFRDNQLDYELFTLQELVDPKDDNFNFRKFYYLLSVQNFVSMSGQTNTEKILSAIRIKQEDITNEFYKEYKKLREDLIKDILKNNKDIKRSQFYNLVVEKAQKIVDRIVFVCFFEDSGLLPENKLIEVVKYGDEKGLSIWSIMKDFFNAVDSGSAKMEIPNGYNGELFKQDNDLNNLKISDEICKKFVELSRFDFSEDLSVNILGHIFEQSISDLERLKSYSDKSIKEQNKRKKEGIFYTPEYIVDYIVKSSIGKYLEEKELEILNEYKLDNKRLKDYGYNKKIIEAYTKYHTFLKKVKVLDPTCGSGAFLVKVFDYLLAEHKRVFRIVSEAEGRSTGSALITDEEFIKPILENNIFGVDLNPESVEITKLSLWFKSAKKGKKLITLKNNIKCGNSLTFNWSKEFPEIINSGGFDVIIGNPPYIKEYTNEKAFNGLHNNKYYEGKMDLWQFFTCIGIDLLKPNGYLSYIAPSSWITNSGAKIMRNKILQESKILEFIDFGDYKVFKQAGIQTMIFVIKKEKPVNNSLEYLKLSKTEDVPNLLNNKKIINFQQKDFLNRPITFIGKKEDSLLLDKIKGKENFQLSEKEVAQGIVGAPDEFFILKDISQFSEKEKMFIKEFYTSSEKYGQPKSNSYIIYLSAKNFENKKIEDFPNLFKHFKPNELILTEAKIKYKTPNKPYYYLHREREEEFFKEGPKIISGSRVDGVQFLYTEKEFYGSRALNFIKTNRINLKYLVGILNSSLSFFWLKNKGKLLGKLLQIDKEPLLGIPICVADINYQNKISERVTKIISKNLEMNSGLHKSHELICHEFGINKINKKLETFYLLSFDDFINESKTVFSIDKKSELLDYFNLQKEKIIKQKSEINDLSREIDRLVYEIYDLTDNEINIIENDNL